MAKTVNTENFPWSIKGISIEARKLAKEGAAKEGLTIGQWLKKIINEGAWYAEVGHPTPACLRQCWSDICCLLKFFVSFSHLFLKNFDIFCSKSAEYFLLLGKILCLR